MASRPRILASFLHGTLEVIDAMGGDLGGRVRASLEPAVLDEIEGAWAAAWLPLSHDVELTSAFFQLVGTERGCQAMRQTMADTFHKPTLRPIIGGAIRIFGLSPGKLLRWGPRIWPLLYKDAGELRVELGEGEGTIWIEGLPPEMADNGDYLRGTASAIAAVFDLTGVRGESRLAGHGRGAARFALEWETGPEAA